MTKKFAKQSSLILDYGKNGKTLKKLPDGGELKKKKPSERKPIITNDPKDPRLKAYNDSLSLYNNSNAAYHFFVKAKFTPKNKAQEKQAKYVEEYIINNSGNAVTKNIKNDWYHPAIKPLYTQKFSKQATTQLKQKTLNGKTNVADVQDSGLASQPVFMQPVQPVVYQKPNPQPNPKSELKNQPETEEQIERIEGYDITPTENKKVIPKPTQDKTDFYIQSLDKNGKQKVKYFNSKKEKDDYDEKLSKDFYQTRKTDNSSVYTAVLPEMENGGTMNKLGVENSLWNNIRAKAGSGKKPTKEMLKQEKKIKRKAPDGITLDGESPFVGNLKKMYENAVQGQQQQVQQIGAKVGQQVADTLMPITPVNNVQKNKPNQNQYNDFNAYQQDLTDWEKENNQRSDYKGDTIEKDGIAVVQMTDKELKNPSKQQWGNHLAKPTPPKNERKRGNYAPYFLGGLAAADLLLPDVNRERQQDFNRPEYEPYYNPYPNGLGSGALAKHGKTLESDDLQLLSKDSYVKPLSPSIVKLKGNQHGEENSDFGEGIPLAANGQVIEAENGETFAEQSNGDKTIFSGKTINPLTGKSFKFHTEELARFENNRVVVPQKRLEKLLITKDVDPQDKFDQLTINTAKAKQMGISLAQNFVQQKTDKLGQIQQNILDISEQTGMKPNEVSKQMKTAKYGMTIPKADGGITTKKLASETQAEYEKRKRGNKEYEKKSKFSEGVKEVGIEKVGNKTYKYGEKEGVAPKSNLKIRPGGTNTDEELVRAYVKRGATYEDVTTKKDGVGYAIGKNDPKLKSLWDKYKGKYAQGTNPQYEYIEQEDPEPIIPPPPILPPKTPPGTPPPEIPPTKIPGMTFDTEEQITPIEYGKVRNGNWKNYVGPAFGVLDRVNNRSDPGINPRLKDVGEFQNRKLAQINSQGRAFQQGATSTGASVAELATGMGGFAEQAANSEAEIQAFNQGNKNMVYNENIGIVNDFAKFNSGINTRNNERRLMAEEFTKQNNVKALNAIGKYSAMEDRDRNAFVVNQGYYPTYGHDKNTLQPNVRPNQNPFDNDAMFQVGDGRYSRNTPSSTQVRTKDGNTTTTNTYTPQKPITPPKPKKVKYGMSLVKEFKRYKP